MTTAREQAREAAWRVQEHLAMDDADVTAAADAASDVWEEKVQGVLDHVRNHTFFSRESLDRIESMLEEILE